MEETILAHLRKLLTDDKQSFILGYCSGKPDDDIFIVDGGIDLRALSVEIWDLVKEWL